MRKHRNWTKTVFPLFVHGDGVEYATRDSLMVWSWGNLLSLFGSLDSHLLISCFPKSVTTSNTWTPLMDWLLWSFTALLEGKHPTTGPYGEPLAKGTVFHALQGKSLTPQGLRGCIWSLQGDHEFFSNVLQLPHWRNPNPCWECDCTQAAGAKPYTVLDHRKRAFAKRSLEEEGLCTHALFKVPGVSTRMVRGDGLHIVFTKGVFAHLLGSILHYCCWYDNPGCRQAVHPSKRLGLLWVQIQKQYPSLGKGITRLANLRLSMFTDERKPHAAPAFLNCKGGETKHLAPVLLEVVKKVLGKEGAREQTAERAMVAALEKACGLVALWDDADIFLTDDEFATSMRLCNDFLTLYDRLNTWALDKGRNLFHIVMKHHTLLHLVENSFFLNPRFHWCFKSEDFVGRLSALAFSVSMGTSSSRLCLKVGPKYRLMLHLRLTRGDMEAPGESWDMEDWDWAEDAGS